MNRLAKFSLFGVGAVAVLVTTGSATLYGVSARKLARTYTVPTITLQVPHGDSAAYARGEHLVTSVLSCQECHGADLGGGVVVEPGPMGYLAAPNLTAGSGGVGAHFDVADWVRALRYGVRADGTSFLIMPSEAYAELADDDMVAIIAYLRELPPVDRSFEPPRLGPVGRALLAAGQLHLIADLVPRDLTPRATVEAAPDAEYGRYLAGIGGCTSCHKPDLSGGLVTGPPGAPLSTNLTAAGPLALWSEADFVRAMRDGRRPDGSEISEFMPWRFSGRMTDDELHAVWLFIRSMPPAETAAK
jgi:cytochrome c553